MDITHSTGRAVNGYVGSTIATAAGAGAPAAVAFPGWVRPRYFTTTGSVAVVIRAVGLLLSFSENPTL